VGVVVSHDRALLEALAARTLWLEAGSLAPFSGPFEALAPGVEHPREDQGRDDGRVRLDHEARRVHVELVPGDLLVRRRAAVGAVRGRAVGDLAEVRPVGDLLPEV